MKKFGLLIALLLPLFLVGCGTQDVKIDPQNAFEVETKTESKTKSDIDVEECIKGCESVVAGKSRSKTEGCIALCKVGAAASSNDLEGCKALQGLERDTCFSAIAVDTKDPSVCENISALLRDGCYTSIATDTKNISICKKIDNPMFRAACEDSVNGN